MIVNSIKILPGGQVIGSGVGEAVAIKHCKLTQCVNSGEELTPGSVCCACLEAELILEDNTLPLAAGMQVELWTAVDGAQAVRQGVFTLEKPTKKSEHSYKITAYDHVAMLDSDLTMWLAENTWSEGQSKTLLELARIVCEACGLELANTDITNGDMLVGSFPIIQTNGRQLMRWISELACCFCRADADGRILLDWYTDSDAMLRPDDPRFYFAGLFYEDYEVAAIEAVQYRLVENNAYLHPPMRGKNTYVIDDGNLIWRNVLGDCEPYRVAMEEKLVALGTYRPCKVALPASFDVGVGDVVYIATTDGQLLRMPVMMRVQDGQRDTLESTGSRSRDSSTAIYSTSAKQTAKQAISNLTGQQIMDKLQVQWVTVEGIGTVLMKKE